MHLPCRRTSCQLVFAPHGFVTDRAQATGRISDTQVSPCYGKLLPDLPELFHLLGHYLVKFLLGSDVGPDDEAAKQCKHYSQYCGRCLHFYLHGRLSCLRHLANKVKPVVKVGGFAPTSRA